MSCNIRFNEKQIDKYVIHEESETEDNEVSNNCGKVSEQANEIAPHKQNVLTNDQETCDDPEARRSERYNLRPKVNTPSRLIESGYSAIMCEPRSYDEAINSNEVRQWKRAMDEEYKSLLKNCTWELVEAPEDQKVIDNRWVFKVKENPDGTIERFKARLVVRGFTQQYGIDYEETFSPVVKYTSVRLILALAASHKMKLIQFDIKTAFCTAN